jgi:hypothetical protein
MSERLNFCKAVLKKKANDLDIKVKPLDPFMDYRDRVNFFITMTEFSPGTFPSMQYGIPTRLLRLDEEDIDYLYNKYSKLLKEELNEQIDKLTARYAEEPHA